MIKGVRISLDIGSARIGVAKCDPEAILATPLATVLAGATALGEVVDFIREFEAICVYVGKPINLAGADTASTQRAIEFARSLSDSLVDTSVSVRLIDERLSTVSAQRGLHDAGRNVKQSRNAIDQASAVVILEQAIALEQNLGMLAGEEVA